jgi:hypothetical protein
MKRPAYRARNRNRCYMRWEVSDRVAVCPTPGYSMPECLVWQPRVMFRLFVVSDPADMAIKLFIDAVPPVRKQNLAHVEVPVTRMQDKIIIRK